MVTMNYLHRLITNRSWCPRQAWSAKTVISESEGITSTCTSFSIWTSLRWITCWEPSRRSKNARRCAKSSADMDWPADNRYAYIHSFLRHIRKTYFKWKIDNLFFFPSKGMSNSSIVGWATVSRCIRVAGLASSPFAADGRADESLGHGDDRCSGRRDQWVRRRHGAGFSRFPIDQSGNWAEFLENKKKL